MPRKILVGKSQSAFVYYSIISYTRYGCFTFGHHLLEIRSLKDTGLELFFSTKSIACKKKHLPAKKAFACNIFVPAILSKSDVKAQKVLIPN
jgi:hypothetical protein